MPPFPAIRFPALFGAQQIAAQTLHLFAQMRDFGKGQPRASGQCRQIRGRTQARPLARHQPDQRHVQHPRQHLQPVATRLPFIGLPSLDRAVAHAQPLRQFIGWQTRRLTRRLQPVAKGGNLVFKPGFAAEFCHLASPNSDIA